MKRKIPHRYPQTTAAVTEDSSRNLSLSDIESILKQLAGTSGACAPTSQPTYDSVNSTLCISPGTSRSWFFDSGCYNHMTYESAMFTSNIYPMNTIAIHIADSS